MRQGLQQANSRDEQQNQNQRYILVFEQKEKQIDEEMEDKS